MFDASELEGDMSCQLPTNWDLTNHYKFIITMNVIMNIMTRFVPLLCQYRPMQDISRNYATSFGASNLESSLSDNMKHCKKKPSNLRFRCRPDLGHCDILIYLMISDVSF